MTSLARLEKALEQIAKVGVRLRRDGFTKATFVEPTTDLRIRLRQSYIVDANVVSKNLDLKLNDPMRRKYPELFQQAEGLHGQNTGVSTKIDWDEFWLTLTHRLPKDVAPLLEDAIEKEHIEKEKKTGDNSGN
ncbi:unnamed protein product [Clonostachys rhizophaga]|uniref:Uncharacterized protein n=1 Tax=Clonostachys rhizophaga TaxID=160324 RepID=A0A9N9W6N2_9HYPO|nr:unnamed protein product [Clonostachys rhizophaga]